jgi:mannonate dehydratase
MTAGTLVTIRRVRAICTAPAGINLVVVKVETSEPGLHGLGCATLAYRHKAVACLVDEYLDPLLAGRDVSRIEDIWQTMNHNAYWRNGPVENNAVSGVDMALWDIKGKMAGMPVYELLGGKCREAAAAYRHADAPTLDELTEKVRGFMAQGLRHVRVQWGGYGGKAAGEFAPQGSPEGAYYDPDGYARSVVAMLDRLRGELGFDIELLHDVHERLAPSEAIRLAKSLEPFRLFFLEDILPPEQWEWFRRARSQCAVPLAMGELFNNPVEWKGLVSERLIDFIRVHPSQIGGITPARKLAALCEAFGVRTAWHGPGDVSPVGHAANVHLDLACPNFGIQEWAGIDERLMEVFPGSPELRGGYIHVNGRPGLGLDIDEKLAARFPCDGAVTRWTQTRLPDGSAHQP